MGHDENLNKERTMHREYYVALLTQIKSLIAEAERSAQAKEDAERTAGKILINGPLGRMLTPPTPLDGVVINNDLLKPLVDEPVLICGPDKRLVAHRLLLGETRFLDSRRQWSAFEKVTGLLKENDLLERAQLELIHLHFQFSFGCMAICRRYFDDVSHLLMGIRGAKLGTLNVGKLSFPAGMAKPNESLEMVLYREFEEETGIKPAMRYPGWSMFRFPNACSMTFSALLETRDPSPPSKCYEVKGGLFTWIPEADLRAALKGDNSYLVYTLKQHGIEVDRRLEITNDGAATYLELREFYPAD